MARHTAKRSRHLISSLIGGLLLGIGASLMLAIYGLIRWDSMWPNIVLVLGIGLGLLVGLLPPSAVAPAVAEAPVVPEAPGDSTPPSSPASPASPAYPARLARLACVRPLTPFTHPAT